MSNQTESLDVPPEPRRRVSWTLAPVVVFVAMALLFTVSLFSGDPSKLPSALIGKQVPVGKFAPLEGLSGRDGPIPGFDGAELGQGHVTVVNFFASWCAPCADEHPMLLELSKRSGLKIYGVNQKDTPENALRFLTRLGNPYARVGVDPSGRGSIEWGVYGMPETFIVDPRGKISFKYVGPISPNALQTKILPAIEAAEKSGAPAQ